MHLSEKRGPERKRMAGEAAFLLRVNCPGMLRTLRPGPPTGSCSFNTKGSKTESTEYMYV